jgi:hypothetical protein
MEELTASMFRVEVTRTGLQERWDQPNGRSLANQNQGKGRGGTALSRPLGNEQGTVSTADERMSWVNGCALSFKRAFFFSFRAWIRGFHALGRSHLSSCC